MCLFLAHPRALMFLCWCVGRVKPWGAVCLLVVLLHPCYLLLLWFGAERPLVVDWLVERHRLFTHVLFILSGSGRKSAATCM